MEFVENCFGDGQEILDLVSSYGSGVAISETEWQLVQEADTKENEMPGEEDEVVVIKYGKEVHEAFAVHGERVLMAQVQILG
jgi:hypothetical protein